MDDPVVSDVLKSIGWDTGFRLPIANEENQALERELARLVIKKSAMGKEYDDISSRCQSLTEHLKYVRQQVAQNQTLLTAYHQQLDTERHKLKLKQAEKDNTVSETRRLAKLTEGIRSRLASKKLQLARNLAKLEKIKTEAEWDNQAMKAWEESIKKRDDDNEMLKKFSEEDRKKLAELETKRKALQNDVFVRKNMLAQMDVDVMNYEQVMKRSGKMLSSLKEEREALVKQWQESVKNLRGKDLAIKRSHVKNEALRETIKQKREEIEELEAFLSNEKSTNKYIQMDINEVNIESLQIRRKHHSAIEQNLMLINENSTKKKLVQRANADMCKIKVEMKRAGGLKEDYQLRINQLKHDMELLLQQDKIITEQSDSATKNADIVDKLIKQAEKSSHILIRQMQPLLNKQYKINCAVSEASEIANVHKAEVCALENALGHIRKQAAAANQALIHKKQILSDLEMKVACLEAQLGNTDPDDMQEFEEMWNIKIQELEESLEQHTEVKNLLHGQILKLQKENLRLVNAMANEAPSHQILKDKLQSFCLQIEGGMKQTKAATLRTQQLQVQENLIKLKVDQLQDALSNADEEIYNMQRYKIDLESTLKERLIEVTAAKDVLFAKRKNLDEDRSRLKADITQRFVKINQFQNKFNLFLGMLGKDDAGEIMSVSTFKIRSAQEKFELQQEGDALDKKIRKTEQEIVAMENTLKVVNLTNKSFKDSLTIVGDESHDAEVMKSMEDELVLRLGALKEKRHKLYLQIDKHKALKAEIDQCLEIKNITQAELDKLENTITQLLKEQEEREEKIERASKHLKLCAKKVDKPQLEKYDRELYIRQLQDTNKSVLYQLADFAVQYPECMPVLRAKFDQQQLELPQQRSTLGSASSDSINTISTESGQSSLTSLSQNPRTSRIKKDIQKLERQTVTNVTSVELTLDLPAAGGESRNSSSMSSAATSTASSRKGGSKSKRQ